MSEFGYLSKKSPKAAIFRPIYMKNRKKELSFDLSIVQFGCRCEGFGFAAMTGGEGRRLSKKTPKKILFFRLGVFFFEAGFGFW